MAYPRGFTLLRFYVTRILAALATARHAFGDDLHAYVRVFDGRRYPLGARVGMLTFPYSPAFAQATWPLSFVPLAVVQGRGGSQRSERSGGSSRRWRGRSGYPALLIAALSAGIGNVDRLVALAIAVPRWWPVAALTRPTPWTVGVAGTIAAASFVIASATARPAGPSTDPLLGEISLPQTPPGGPPGRPRRRSARSP